MSPLDMWFEVVENQILLSLTFYLTFIFLTILFCVMKGKYTFYRSVYASIALAYLG